MLVMSNMSVLALAGFALALTVAFVVRRHAGQSGFNAAAAIAGACGLVFIAPAAWPVSLVLSAVGMGQAAVVLHGRGL